MQVDFRRIFDNGAERGDEQWWMGFLGILLVAGTSVADYLTGPEIAFSLFYVLVVVLVAWHARTLADALPIAIWSAVAWLVVEWIDWRPQTVSVLVWNAGTRLTIFVAVAILLVRLKRALLAEQATSRIDFLTGALNNRAFSELAAAEISKASRHERPLAIAYFDLDDFKVVNDERGHSHGDRALRLVVDILRSHLRASDFVARVGGDEFILLLPETHRAELVPILERMLLSLRSGMREHDLPITFSMGAAVFETPDLTVDDMVRVVDQLMYEAKMAGKDRIRVAPVAEGSDRIDPPAIRPRGARTGLR